MEETWPLRAKVLRKGQNLNRVDFAGDERPGTRHYGVEMGSQIVAVVTLLDEPCPLEIPGREQNERAVRLRGMAVDDAFQGQGFGRALLDHVLKVFREGPRLLLWCQARLHAVPFYERFGFAGLSEVFDIEGIGPHITMARRVGRETADSFDN